MSPPSILPRCRVGESKQGTTLKQCNALIKKVAKDPDCAAQAQPVNVGYGAACVQPCAARAYLKCSNQMKAQKKASVFNCHTAKAAAVKKRLRKLINQECKKLPAWHRDGGCKNGDGVGNHGCSSLKCPRRCVQLPGCYWMTRENQAISTSEVLTSFSNPALAYEGRCVLREVVD